MKINKFLRNKDVLNLLRSLGIRFTVSNHKHEIGLNFSLETKQYKNQYSDPSIIVHLRYYIDEPFGLFKGFSDIRFNVYCADGLSEESEVVLTEKIANAFKKHVYPDVDFFKNEKLNIRRGQWYRFETLSTDEESVILTGDSIVNKSNDSAFSLRFLSERKFLADGDNFSDYLTSIFIAISEAINLETKEHANVL